MRFLFVAICLFFFACEEEEPLSQAEGGVERVPGQIMVYNSCGISGAAEQARDVLRSKGFDVLRETDPRWANYEETIIAIRNPHWAGYNQLKAALATENFIVLLDTLSGDIGATVFLGRDYKKVLKIKKGES